MALRCSAPLRLLDLAHLADSVRTLDAGGIDEYLFEFSDGSFVRSFAGMEALVPVVAGMSETPRHAMLYVDAPDRHVARLVAAGCQRITVHAETGIHLHRTLSSIREAGASPGIAVLPTTSLTSLSYLLPFADRLVMQTAEPFVSPALPLSTAPERVRILRENIRYHEYRCEIVVAGGMDTQHAARLAHFGAECVVLDEALFFAPDRALTERSVEDFKSAVLVGKKLV